jgi:hypothetical protein
MVIVAIVVAGCSGGKPAKQPPPVRIDPPLTDVALRASICKSCDPRRQFCDLLVGTGAAEGTPATTGGCSPLPADCRGRTHCRCFPALKGCRCEHTDRGFDVECPAP